MSLKISHVDHHQVIGELDGCYAFEMKSDGQSVVARIANWTKEFANRTVVNAAEMRTMSYEAVARFREDQRRRLIA